ncbi:uncharacterized protein VTP21DRAFT_2215 [Calcarisporiella thermophila]|uniref:uncharacterized protein n=1 Tax=Calcarisporiella thermophila TaxID=911321 RepID=UPI0037439158
MMISLSERRQRKCNDLLLENNPPVGNVTSTGHPTPPYDRMEHGSIPPKTEPSPWSTQGRPQYPPSSLQPSHDEAQGKWSQPTPTTPHPPADWKMEYPPHPPPPASNYPVRHQGMTSGFHHGQGYEDYELQGDESRVAPMPHSYRPTHAEHGMDIPGSHVASTSMGFPVTTLPSQPMFSPSASEFHDPSDVRKALTNSRRAAQNRAAQRAFRQRKERYVKDLEAKARDFEALKVAFDTVRKENEMLHDMVAGLQQEVLRLRESNKLGSGQLPDPASLPPTELPPAPHPMVAATQALPPLAPPTHLSTPLLPKVHPPSHPPSIDSASAPAVARDKQEHTPVASRERSDLHPPTLLASSSSSQSSPSTTASSTPVIAGFDQRMLDILRHQSSRNPFSSFFEVPQTRGWAEKGRKEEVLFEERAREALGRHEGAAEGSSLTMESRVVGKGLREDPSLMFAEDSFFLYDEEARHVMDDFCDMLRARPPPDLPSNLDTGLWQASQ